MKIQPSSQKKRVSPAFCPDARKRNTIVQIGIVTLMVILLLMVWPFRVFEHSRISGYHPGCEFGDPEGKFSAHYFPAILEKHKYAPETLMMIGDEVEHDFYLLEQPAAIFRTALNGDIIHDRRPPVTVFEVNASGHFQMFED